MIGLKTKMFQIPNQENNLNTKIHLIKWCVYQLILIYNVELAD